MSSFKSYTYTELAETLGITVSAAKQRAYKYHWRRYKDNHGSLKVNVPDTHIRRELDKPKKAYKTRKRDASYTRLSSDLNEAYTNEHKERLLLSQRYDKLRDENKNLCIKLATYEQDNIRLRELKKRDAECYTKDIESLRRELDDAHKNLKSARRSWWRKILKVP